MTSRRRVTALASAVVLLALGLAVTHSAGAGAAPDRAESDLARTATGWVRGTIADGHRLFKGIPFAAPPVGDLRWRPPQAAASWTGVRDATGTVASTPCPQPQLATLPGESNRLGSTIVRILGREGRTLRVAELDAIDGTPVLDIKPVMREFLPRTEVRQPSWVGELMREYWSVS